MDTAASISELLDSAARACPAAAALGAPGREDLAYEDLWNLVQRTAGQLEAAGAAAGNIAMVLPNGPEMAAAFLSVCAAATAAPLNPLYRAHEFDFYFQDLSPSALVVADGLDSPAIAVTEHHRVPVIRLRPSADGPAGAFTLAGLPDARTPASRPTPDQVARVLHTSGTTARPKIVPLTHANLCASADNVASVLRLCPEDRCLEIPFAVGIGKPEEIEQVWIAKDQIRRDTAIFSQHGKLLTGKVFGFSGESGAFEQHPLDFGVKLPHAPALDPAHLNIEFTGNGVLDLEKFYEMRPTQFFRQRRDDFFGWKQRCKTDHPGQIRLAVSGPVLCYQFFRQCRKNSLTVWRSLFLENVPADSVADMPVQQTQFDVYCSRSTAFCRADQVTEI